MNDTSPFFSICIPAYNCGHLILEAFQSIARQDFTDWEVVVFNDGSNDDTARICLNQTIIPIWKYKYDCGLNQGQYAARKRLLAMSSGRMVISLDADDMLFGSTALSTLYKAVVANDCDMVLFNATRAVDGKTRFVDYSTLESSDSGILDSLSVKTCFVLDYRLNNVAFKAYRRELAADMGDHPHMNMTDDRLQSLLLFKAAKRIVLVDEVLYYYRPNNSSVTNTVFLPAYFENQMQVEDEVDELAIRIGVSVDDRRAFRCMVLCADLGAISRTAHADRICRLNFYREIRTSSYYPQISFRRLRSMRADWRLMLRLFDWQQFYLLDFFLSCRRVAKALLLLLNRRARWFSDGCLPVLREGHDCAVDGS